MRKHIGKYLLVLGSVLVVVSIVLTNLYPNSEDYPGSFGVASCYPGLIIILFGAILLITNKNTNENILVDKYISKRNRILIGFLLGTIIGIIQGIILSPLLNLIIILSIGIIVIAIGLIQKIKNKREGNYFYFGFMSSYFLFTIIGLSSNIIYKIINTPIYD